MWFTLLVLVFRLSSSSLLNSVFSSCPHAHNRALGSLTPTLQKPLSSLLDSVVLRKSCLCYGPPWHVHTYLPTALSVTVIPACRWIRNMPECLGLCCLRAGLPDDFRRRPRQPRELISSAPYPTAKCKGQKVFEGKLHCSSYFELDSTALWNISIPKSSSIRNQVKGLFF